MNNDNKDELLALCRSALDYNHDTGKFTWKSQPPYGWVKLGDEAGHECKSGYINIGLGGKVYLAHRLAHLMYYGYMPVVVEHINGEKSDNRIINLKAADYSKVRKKEQINNRSGHRGVWYDEKRRHYQVYIQYKGRRKTLGRVREYEDAVRMRLDAENQLDILRKNGVV